MLSRNGTTRSSRTNGGSRWMRMMASMDFRGVSSEFSVTNNVGHTIRFGCTYITQQPQPQQAMYYNQCKFGPDPTFFHLWSNSGDDLTNIGCCSTNLGVALTNSVVALTKHRDCSYRVVDAVVALTNCIKARCLLQSHLLRAPGHLLLWEYSPSCLICCPLTMILSTGLLTRPKVPIRSIQKVTNPVSIQITKYFLCASS